MNVADLKNLASQLGIRGTARMRKDDLVASIVEHQSGVAAPARTAAPAQSAPAPEAPDEQVPPRARASRGSGRRAESGVTTPAPVAGTTQAETSSVEKDRRRAELQDELARTPERALAERIAGPQETRETSNEPQKPQQPQQERIDLPEEPSVGRQEPSVAQLARQEARQSRRDAQAARQEAAAARQEALDGRQGSQGDQSARAPGGGIQQPRSAAGPQAERQGRQAAQLGPTGPAGQAGSGGQSGAGAKQPAQVAQVAPPVSLSAASAPPSGSGLGAYDDDDDRPGGRRRNRQRSRDRKRRGVTPGGAQEFEPEMQVADDDVLVPVAGILDVLDNYAFVRTSGYLPGPSDVYVPLGLVKKHGLRKGDAVTGAVKALREGEQPQQGGGNGRQKFNALVRLDAINGANPDEAITRSEFAKLTPLHPQERLRLETDTAGWTARIIDLVAPVGKGQRGLVIAPAKAGRTTVVQAIANAVTANNPECHLMVVLVDERPEEVTDMQRAVKGEVIASTFDRPAEDHTTVAELAIERAKRLVELGHDVVVLLDSITKLGRAYNLAAPASGRILSGGVDSAALYPPKRFFGAARNIENGGSLTIIATALVETGSRMDEVIFEEFTGTANMELTLSGELAARRIFPAVEVTTSGSRREELLMSEEELSIVWKLRRVLGGLEPQAAMELLLQRLKRTRSNIEFLRQVQLTPAAKLGDGDA
ncbi:transcription termination factor Rho [Dermatophilaceae bacterium Soc4.6]